MRTLDYIDEDEKILISILVDSYLQTKNISSNMVEELMYEQGCTLFVLLSYNDFSKNPCHFTIYKNDENLIGIFCLDEEYENLDFIHLVKLRKSTFLSRLSFVQNLFEDDLIFFEEEFVHEISHLNYESEKDYKNDYGNRYYKQPIFSKSTVEFLDKYYMSNIIPSSYLINFRLNNFQTPEEKRFIANEKTGRIAVKAAIVIALSSPLIGKIYDSLGTIMIKLWHFSTNFLIHIIK